MDKLALPVLGVLSSLLIHIPALAQMSTAAPAIAPAVPTGIYPSTSTPPLMVTPVGAPATATPRVTSGVRVVEPQRARNVARQAAEKANGGLSRYRAENAMHRGQGGQLRTTDAGDSWIYVIYGGPPGFTAPSIETAVQVKKATFEARVLYNGAIRSTPVVRPIPLPVGSVTQPIPGVVPQPMPGVVPQPIPGVVPQPIPGVVPQPASGPLPGTLPGVIAPGAPGAVTNLIHLQ